MNSWIRFHKAYRNEQTGKVTESKIILFATWRADAEKVKYSTTGESSIKKDIAGIKTLFHEKGKYLSDRHIKTEGMHSLQRFLLGIRKSQGTIQTYIQFAPDKRKPL